MMSNASNIALEVSDLRVRFDNGSGRPPVDAVAGISFTLRRGKTLAIVGESGSGKSVTSYSILRLIEAPGKIVGGRILLHGKDGQPPIDLVRLGDNDETLYQLRGGRISMIYQEPMTALSPVHTVGNQIGEAVRLHRTQDRREIRRLTLDVLAKVGINDPEKRIKQYPFEFSGGMRQRVVIAMALVCQPEILIADEPTTALDVTIQAQILKLIKDLQRELHTSVLFITHDLGVVAQVADDVIVMKKGEVVESGSVRDLFRNPQHPYTRELISLAEGKVLI